MVRLILLSLSIAVLALCALSGVAHYRKSALGGTVATDWLAA